MKKEVLLSLILIIIPGIIFAQKKSRLGKNIVGNYRYISLNKLSGQSLELKSDHTYIYYRGGDIVTYHSDGVWSLKGDTLILTSAIQNEDIPIQVKEEVVDSIKDYIVFDWINNSDNDAMIATLSFNGDTSTYCDPFIGYNCKMKIGSVDSIILRLGNDAVSKWYKVSNKNFNKLKVTIPVHDVLAHYLFFDKEKFLFRKGNLYPIKDSYITELSTDMKTVKRRVILKKEEKMTK